MSISYAPAMSDATYDDDRPGCMRASIARERAKAAMARYTRGALRRHAEGHGLRLGAMTKDAMAWKMAAEGLISAEGLLRDGFDRAPVTA